MPADRKGDLALITFMKALPLGIILTFVVSLFIGSGGSTGGFLNIHYYTVEGVSFYWSWVLLIAGTGLAFALIWMMGD